MNLGVIIHRCKALGGGGELVSKSGFEKINVKHRTTLVVTDREEWKITTPILIKKISLLIALVSFFGFIWLHLAPCWNFRPVGNEPQVASATFAPPLPMELGSYKYRYMRLRARSSDADLKNERWKTFEPT